MPDARTARVLIVDDEESSRLLLRHALEVGNMQVEAVGSAGEALERLRQDRFHLLLCDLVLPDMDGIELIRAAAAVDSQLVTIAISGRGTIQTAVEAMKAGAFDYIEKPVDVQSLLTVTARAVDVRHLRDEAVELRQTVLVYELSQAIVHERDPRAVLRKVVECAVTEYGADEAAIMVFSDDGVLSIAATWGRGRDHLVGETVAIDAGAVGWVVRERRPLLLNGPVQDPQLVPRYPRADVHSTMICPLVTGQKLVGVLAVAAVKAQRQFSPGQLKTLGILAGIAAASIDAVTQHAHATEAERERLRALEKLRDALVGTIETIAAAAEVRDAYTAGHERRVADLARAIATELGLPSDVIEGVHLGGLVHDIGKLGIPTEILVCPRRLTDIEMSLVRTHAQGGYDILKGVEFPWPIADMVHQHHERTDGSGYPQRLAGHDMLIEGRILAVADVVEAMSSHRPYRPALGIEPALAAITTGAGVQFDADVVAVCVRLVRDGALPIQ
jgi:response regulator RpfG family c-di-GMP phosphodiesterase